MSTHDGFFAFSGKILRHFHEKPSDFGTKNPHEVNEVFFFYHFGCRMNESLVWFVNEVKMKCFFHESMKRFFFVSDVG